MSEIKTCLGYGGIDTVVRIDGHIIGELQKITYNEYTNLLELTCINFAMINSSLKEPIEWKSRKIIRNLKNVTIEQISQASYDTEKETLISNKIYKAFNNVTFLYEKGGIDIDDVIEQTTFICSFDNVVGPYTLPTTKDNLEETCNYMKDYLK